MQRSRVFAVVPSIPRSQITRETIVSRPGASGLTISPVAFRFLITAPAGKPSPIFALTKCFAQRRAVTADRVARAELRGRNRKSLYDLSSRNQGQFLVRDAHHDLGRKTGRAAVRGRSLPAKQDNREKMDDEPRLAGAATASAVQL